MMMMMMMMMIYIYIYIFLSLSLSPAQAQGAFELTQGKQTIDRSDGTPHGRRHKETQRGTN